MCLLSLFFIALLFNHAILSTSQFDNAIKVIPTRSEYILCQSLPGKIYARIDFDVFFQDRGIDIRTVSTDPFRYIPVSTDVDLASKSDYSIGSGAFFSSLRFVLRTACVDYTDNHLFSRALKTPGRVFFDLETASGETTRLSSEYGFEINSQNVVDYRFFSTVQHSSSVYAIPPHAVAPHRVDGNDRISWDDTVCIRVAAADDWVDEIVFDFDSVRACQTYPVETHPSVIEVWDPTSSDRAFFCDKVAWDEYANGSSHTQSPIEQTFLVQEENGAESKMSVSSPDSADRCFRFLNHTISDADTVVHVQFDVVVNLKRDIYINHRRSLLNTQPMSKNTEDDFRIKHVMIPLLLSPKARLVLANESITGSIPTYPAFSDRETLLLVMFLVSVIFAGTGLFCLSSYNKRSL